ncbi:MAG: DNA-processing protein DprA [Candidatus Saccharibacteria bacterium]
MTSTTTMQTITQKHKAYPILLREIYDAPKTLHILGSLPDMPMLAIVGTRRPTPYGKTIAYRLAKDLAQSGICIVSGLAYGIDGIVHRAALDAGGKTVAVLGCGLDRCYPASHQPLMHDIVAGGGAVISEYDAGTPPLRHHFPARNRIIAGISLGTLVPEADARSGSLITASLALGENRCVMAVPGAITSERSSGPNNLLKAGATPVTSAADVCAALNLTAVEITRPIGASAIEQGILDRLNQGPADAESLATELGLPIATVLATLSLLEISGRIRSLGGALWMLRG